MAIRLVGFESLSPDPGEPDARCAGVSSPFRDGRRDRDLMKAYVISEVDIHDPHEYASYAQATARLIDQYGGKVLARGGRTRAFDGAPPAERVVLVEFESIEAANEFRHSKAYRELVRARDASSSARMFAVESEEQ